MGDIAHLAKYNHADKNTQKPPLKGYRMSNIRVHISGEWWGHDFSTFFRDLEVLARLIETRSVSFGIDGEWHIAGTTVLATPNSGDTTTNRRIRVHALNYNSPGFTDLSGAGKVMEQIRLFLEFCITKVIEHNQRKAANELERIKIQYIKRMLTESKFTDDIDPIMKDFLNSDQSDNLIRLIMQKNITAAEPADQTY